MQRSQGRKISKFPGSQLLPADSQLTFISGGVNYRIGLADFLAALGVTGSLEQLGDISGVPVLDIQGPVNRIRNIVGGSGITVDQDPEESVRVNHNITASNTGVPVFIDTGELSPVIRSLVAGPGIALAGAGNTIQITTSEVPPTSKTVTVGSLSDLPAPVAGVIALEDDTEYLFLDDIDFVTTRLVAGQGCVLRGAEPDLISLTYSGSVDFVTSVDGVLRLVGISINAPSGRCVNFSDSTGTRTLYITNCILTADRCVLYQGGRGLLLQSSGFIHTSSGVTIQGTNTLYAALSLCNFVSFGGVSLDLTGSSSLSNLTLGNCVSTLLSPGSVFLSGAGNSGLVGSADVHHCRIANPGVGSPISGINVNTDTKWSFHGNSLIQDTRRRGFLSMEANATTTPIAAVNTPVLVAGTWVSGPASGFGQTAAGRLTYNMPEPAAVTITARLTILMSSGGSNNLSLVLYKNGSPLVGSRARGSASSTVHGHLATIWEDDAVQGDFYELFVSNNTGSTTVIITSAVFRASK